MTSDQRSEYEMGVSFPNRERAAIKTRVPREFDDRPGEQSEMRLVHSGLR